MVVIDGIADLIKGANDETESIAVVEELYRLAGIYNTCIVTILHFIPSGLKLRGHLGSELQRKAAAILSIEKDTDPSVSVVKALKVRDGSPLDVPIMQFAWDKDVRMHVYLGEKPKEEKEKRKEDELVAVARDIFGRQDFITYVDLAEQIQAILDVKERTAKSYIKFMREKEIILKDPSNQSYYIIGNLKTGELMIPLDKETFEAYMERLLEQVEKVVGALDKKNKKPQNYLNGERLYDNQDVCLLLNISKRTLQRYRDNGLKYYTILHKTYYREKDLHEFIRRYFDGENVEKGKTKECNGDERIEGGMLSDDKDEPMEEDKPVDEGKLTEDA